MICCNVEISNLSECFILFSIFLFCIVFYIWHFSPQLDALSIPTSFIVGTPLRVALFALFCFPLFRFPLRTKKIFHFPLIYLSSLIQFRTFHLDTRPRVSTFALFHTAWRTWHFSAFHPYFLCRRDVALRRFIYIFQLSIPTSFIVGTPLHVAFHFFAFHFALKRLSTFH